MSISKQRRAGQMQGPEAWRLVGRALSPAADSAIKWPCSFGLLILLPQALVSLAIK